MTQYLKPFGTIYAIAELYQRDYSQMHCPTKFASRWPADKAEYVKTT